MEGRAGLREGREGGEMMDGGLQRRTEGGTLFLCYSVMTPLRSDTAVAAVHLTHVPPPLPLLLTQMV